MERIDKMVFSDGTAKWELKTITNAKTLEGNTLQEVLNQALQQSTKVKLESGAVASGSTIPLPSGFTRQQCRYAITALSVSMYTYDTQTKSVSWDINQDTGYVSVSIRGEKVNGRLSGYLCIAVK